MAELPDDVLMDHKTCAAQIKKWQDDGLTVGFTNGYFDIIHAGHVVHLTQMKEKCDRLVVSINSDISATLFKGPKRPINPLEARAIVLAGLKAIDAVTSHGATHKDGDNTAIEFLKMAKPDLYLKGGDYTPETLPETEIMRAFGGDVIIMPFYDGYSTTNIIKKSRA